MAGAEKEGVADDRVGVAAKGGVADVRAGDLEARGVEGGLSALGVEVAVAGEFDANNIAAMPGKYMRIVYFSVGLGAILLVISRPVKKLMGNVE